VCIAELEVKGVNRLWRREVAPLTSRIRPPLYRSSASSHYSLHTPHFRLATELLSLLAQISCAYSLTESLSHAREPFLPSTSNARQIQTGRQRQAEAHNYGATPRSSLGNAGGDW
jgi:hypothetical protein